MLAVTLHFQITNICNATYLFAFTQEYLTSKTYFKMRSSFTLFCSWTVLMLMRDISLMVCGEQLAVPCWTDNQSVVYKRVTAHGPSPSSFLLLTDCFSRERWLPAISKPFHRRDFYLLYLSFCLLPSSSALFLPSNTTDSGRCRSGNCYPLRC